ncbi:hypothetical protein P7C70_g3196, partial [Phenoliferia sp. Uapishka_3]
MALHLADISPPRRALNALRTLSQQHKPAPVLDFYRKFDPVSSHKSTAVRDNIGASDSVKEVSGRNDELERIAELEICEGCLGSEFRELNDSLSGQESLALNVHPLFNSVEDKIVAVVNSTGS